jgi:hypothetical protein
MRNGEPFIGPPGINLPVRKRQASGPVEKAGCGLQGTVAS